MASPFKKTYARPPTDSDAFATIPGSKSKCPSRDFELVEELPEAVANCSVRVNQVKEILK
jgi:hypothetical protein